MIQDKDELILKKRFAALAEKAYYGGRVLFTDFLDLNEQTILFESVKEFQPVYLGQWGGYTEAERKIFCFSPKENLEEIQFPICILKIEAVNPKFSDVLTHRDFLGAILNLGIVRSKIGDILVNDSAAYVFCQENMKDFIVQQLNKIKHTSVLVKEEESGVAGIQPKYEEMKGSVSSLRLDAILPVFMKGSRNQLSKLVAGEKIFVNGKMISSNSYLIKEEDVVSVRGFGKFVFKEVLAETKKGRYYILLYKYI